MNRSIVAVVLLVFCMLGTDSAHAFGRPRPRPRPTPTATPVPTPTATPYTYSAEELEGVRLINAHRASIGLATVTINDFISFQCLSHNGYMIQQGRPSHDGFVDRSNAIQKKFNVQRVSEVVAYNFSSPAGVVNAWLNSPGHKEALEGPTFRRIGYSLRTDANGKKYYTSILSE